MTEILFKERFLGPRPECVLERCKKNTVSFQNEGLPLYEK